MVITILDILLNEEGAYWPPGTSNKFGEISLGTPIQIRCKESSNRREMISKEGKTYVSTGTVFTDTEIVEGGWVWIGTYADKPSVPTRNIQNVSRTKDTENEEILYVGTF